MLAMQISSKDPGRSREIKHVIFDVDGTLVENMELIVRSVNFAVGGILGKKFSRDELYARFGPTLEQIIAELVPAEEEDRAVQTYHAYYREHFRELASVYPGILDLITHLEKEDIGMALYTGSDGRMTKTTLELSGLQKLFPVVVTADDVKEQKPDPEGLIRVLDLMGASHEGALYLGDAVRDIVAAKRASMLSAAALWGFGDPAALRSSSPDYVFEKPFDALHRLK